MRVYFLERIRTVKNPRKDWDLRWYSAARAVNNEGVVIVKDKNGRPTNIKAARKDSPIWIALANGAGGFKDSIGSGKPPFAYGSGIGWIEKEIHDKENIKSFKDKLKDKILSMLPKIISLRII